MALQAPRLLLLSTPTSLGGSTRQLISDDVILFATKMWKILNKRYLWKYWSSVLETWHHKCASKRNKMTPLVLLPWQQFGRWCCVNKNCNSRFCFKTRTIYPNQSNDGTKDNMGTISVPSRTLCPTVEVANGDFLLFDRKRLGPKELLWKQHSGSHFVSFLMHIYGAKFQEHCFNISRDIIYSVFSTS